MALERLIESGRVKMADIGSIQIRVELTELLEFVEQWARFCKEHTNPSNNSIKYMPERLWLVKEMLHIYMTSNELTDQERNRTEQWLKEQLKRIIFSLRLR